MLDHRLAGSYRCYRGAVEVLDLHYVVNNITKGKGSFGVVIAIPSPGLLHRHRRDGENYSNILFTSYSISNTRCIFKC